MINYSTFQIWLVIALVGAGTFFMRYSFLGAIGNRPMPPWLLRILRYTAVSVLPALAAPLVLWPDAANGQPDPARLAAACATVVAGVMTRSALAAILAGAAMLSLGLYLS
ncbi:AzlD domain-containing protein [Paracoccus albus]|uniref:AzlD domain-containing protein n=1 Tax=Paracoccus albus TaxID=3017784 RepID=UPI0022F13DB5|nr:AzlD domain-containing protein [Paracoccus albus]WBU60250.1 AzlD domain-containing protein [Paracoccus albus]